MTIIIEISWSVLLDMTTSAVGFVLETRLLLIIVSIYGRNITTNRGHQESWS